MVLSVTNMLMFGQKLRMCLHTFPFVEQHLPLAYVGLMTFILIMSSVTMVLAVEAGHRNDKKKVIVWMFWTIVGGATFVGSQAWEWYHFIVGTDTGALRHVWSQELHTYVEETVYGANMTVNEYGVPQFANYFLLYYWFPRIPRILRSCYQFYYFLKRIKRNLRKTRTLRNG
jgi:cytochrome c oxidase subunit 3